MTVYLSIYYPPHHLRGSFHRLQQTADLRVSQMAQTPFSLANAFNVGCDSVTLNPSARSAVSPNAVAALARFRQTRAFIARFARTRSGPYRTIAVKVMSF